MPRNPDNLPLPRKQHVDQALRAHLALHRAMSGYGDDECWCELADAANIVEMLVMLGKRTEREAAYAAMDVLSEARRRQRETGYLSLSDPEPLKTIVSAYDRALERLSRGTIALARALVEDRIRQGEAAGVEVVQ